MVLFVSAACSLSVVLPAWAEDSTLFRGGFQYNDAGAVPANDDSLYKALGEQEKIAAFTKDFVDIISRDPQIGRFFTNVKLDRLTKMLTDQFIDLSGGPVKYAGRDMKEVHSTLMLTNADFNKLAEDL